MIVLNIIALLCAIGWTIFDFGWEPIIVLIGFMISLVKQLKPKKKNNSLLWFLGGATVGAIVVSENQKKTKNIEDEEELNVKATESDSM